MYKMPRKSKKSEDLGMRYFNSQKKETTTHHLEGEFEVQPSASGRMVVFVKMEKKDGKPIHRKNWSMR